MKTVFALVLAVVVMGLSATAGFVCGVDYQKSRPTPLANNTLRWERDPNNGTLLYGWYEEDGQSFNYVATASRNRMGAVADKKTVPAHKWVQVD